MSGGKSRSMPSVMKHDFSMVPKVDIPRSAFDRSHGYKTTFDSGYLIPVFYDLAYPGDTHSLKMSHFTRLSTPLKPVMDNMYLDTFFFAVPIRLVQDNFQKLMGEQRNPGDSISYILPTMTSPASGPAVHSLSDYLTIPTVGQVAGANTLTFVSLWHRAYNLIFNEWFRDENLQNSVVVDVDDGPDTYTDYVLLRRGKRHDYFTSALPWPQKGTAVTIPLGTEANIKTAQVNSGSPLSILDTAGAYKRMGAASAVLDLSASAGAAGERLYADLSTATAATVNALRLAFQVQSLLEQDARGGTRYTEIIRSHFGVTSPDARLQRPEYLGGGSSQINFYPVAQTQATGASGTTTAQGNLAAMAISSGGNGGFTKSFTEHTLLLGLVSVRADLNYQQGINRLFSMSTRYDFYWPTLANLGEQTILNKEIYADGSANDLLTFGYQERYAELRYKPSNITGLFRSTAAGTLDIWHLAQDFATLPTLGTTFIQETPPVDRVVAVPSEPEFLFDAFFTYKSVRPLPVYSVPYALGRF